MTLSTALLLVGALVLLALGVQAVLAVRRAAPRRRELPPAEGDGRVEPALDGAAPPAPASTDGAAREPGGFGAHDGSAEPGAVGGAADGDARPPAWRPPALRRPARLDPLIDALVTLSLESPVSGEQVLAHLPATRRVGSKPLHIEGLEVDSGHWEAPAPGRRYGELQAGVQLASRSGALNEIEYSEFVQKVQAFAESVGAMPDFPDMLAEVARARELDALAAPLDAQLSLTLKCRGAAWSVPYLQQVAARHALVPGAVPGRLVLPGAEEGAPPVLVLSFDAQAALADDPQQAAVREVVLTLDVPQTPESVEPFPLWHRSAGALAAELDAQLVDDQGQAVTLQAFAAIGDELQQLYRQLQALDLAAGSPAARRVFA